VLANLAWCDAHDGHIDANREMIVFPNGNGFAVGLLANAGLTPAARVAENRQVNRCATDGYNGGARFTRRCRTHGGLPVVVAGDSSGAAASDSVG
jgi:hypothetical protein